jgi:hypothetical protein
MITRCLHILIVFLVAGVARGQDSRFQFDANGNLLLQVSTTPGAPVILSQPQMQVVAPGELVSFFVTAADPRGLTYQWRFNGTNLPAPSADVLAFSNVTTTNQGPYDVVLSNSFGSVTSAPAILWIDSRGCGMPDTWQLAHCGISHKTPRETLTVTVFPTCKNSSTEPIRPTECLGCFDSQCRKMVESCK